MINFKISFSQAMAALHARHCPHFPPLRFIAKYISCWSIFMPLSRWCLLLPRALLLIKAPRFLFRDAFRRCFFITAASVASCLLKFYWSLWYWRLLALLWQLWRPSRFITISWFHCSIRAEVLPAHLFLFHARPSSSSALARAHAATAMLLAFKMMQID